MRRDRRGGFILVSVLGAMIVIAGLGAAAAYLVQTAVIGAANEKENLTSDSLMHAGVELAAYELFVLRRPVAQMTGRRIRLDDGVVTLFVTSEAGKIDLNGATPELLAGLWASIGAPQMKPETFAARVQDYRDEDSEPSENGGAEAAQYASAGPTRQPSDSPFEQPDEIQNVLGVTLEAARALRPMLTVHNPSGRLSVYDTPLATLRALPNGGNIIDRVRTVRTMPQGEDEERVQTLLGEAAQFLVLEREAAAYTVRVETERNGARRVSEMILTRSRAPDALYFVTDRTERPSS